MGFMYIAGDLEGMTANENPYPCFRGNMSDQPSDDYASGSMGIVFFTIASVTPFGYQHIVHYTAV